MTLNIENQLNALWYGLVYERKGLRLFVVIDVDWNSNAVGGRRLYSDIAFVLCR